MASCKDPDLQRRQSDAAAAKKAALEKFRAASDDPAVTARHATRAAANETRLVRIAEREAAKRAREAELAEQAARAAELALQAQCEAEKATALAAAEKAEREVLLAAEQKAARELDTQPAKLQRRNAAGGTDSADMPVKTGG
jgi:hypothetical protein